MRVGEQLMEVLMLHKNMSKAEAFEESVRMLDEAFGDNFNDIDMIRYAGLGVAMGNAADEVKEVADIVTDINDNEGERQILDKYFK